MIDWDELIDDVATAAFDRATSYEWGFDVGKGEEITAKETLRASISSLESEIAALKGQLQNTRDYFNVHDEVVWVLITNWHRPKPATPEVE
jgi:hypothetical protein